jgi:hypothetical protein
MFASARYDDVLVMRRGESICRTAFFGWRFVPRLEIIGQVHQFVHHFERAYDWTLFPIRLTVRSRPGSLTNTHQAKEMSCQRGQIISEESIGGVH